MSPELLPEKIMSASGCLCSNIPDWWCVSWASYTHEERQKAASEFGVDSDRTLSKITKWITRRLGEQPVCPNAMVSTRYARKFVKKFLKSLPEDVVLIGIGIDASIADDFLDSTVQPPTEVWSSTRERIMERRPLEEPHTVLGYEILGLEGDGFHSWLCNGLQKKIFRELDIRPGRLGFIENEQDAIKAAEYCNRDKLETEPAWWYPWIVVQYDL